MTLKYSQFNDWRPLRGLTAQELLELLSKGAEAFMRRVTKGRVHGNPFQPNDIVPVILAASESGDLQARNTSAVEFHSQGHLTLYASKGFRSTAGNWELVVRVPSGSRMAAEQTKVVLTRVMGQAGITQSDADRGVRFVSGPVSLPQPPAKPQRPSVWPSFGALSVLREQQGIGNGGYAPID